MKTIRYISLFLALVFATTACETDFLERTQPGEISLQSFYKTQEDMEYALNAVYAPIQLPYYVSTLMLPDFMSDNAVKGSTYGDNSLQWNEMIEFRGVASSRILAWKWDITFEVIYKANLVLTYGAQAEMDADLRNRYFGEALFMRAYMYFENVISWGGVPIITEPLANYYIPKNTAEEVWAQIEKDLEQAIEFLPEKSGYPANEIGRATKGAAKALLAKAYLYQKKYAEAEAKFKEVAESTEYSLDPSYAHEFSLEGENGSGSLFEINFATLGEDAVATAEGNFIVEFQGARDITGWGFNQGSFDLLDEFGDYRISQACIDKINTYIPSDPIYAGLATKLNALKSESTVYLTHTALSDALKGTLTDLEITKYGYVVYRSAFEATDPRFASTFYFLGETVNGIYVDPVTASDDYTGVYNRKAVTYDNMAIWRLEPINERIIRLADVYLLYAEAAAQNNNLPVAKSYLNKVRERARGGNNAILPDFPNYKDGEGYQYQDNKTDLLKAIANERRLELAMEHHRFWDLVRTGEAKNVLENFDENVHGIWPIPQGDIDRSGGILKQNPGY